jgi:hypothetical protein
MSSSSSSGSTDTSTTSNEKLGSFLKNGEDWSRLKTSIPGVFVLKMPEYRNSPTRLAVELNPVDASGSPTKRRGLLLRSKEELDEFKELFQYEKLATLLQTVESLNPQGKKSTRAKPGEDVLEL